MRIGFFGPIEHSPEQVFGLRMLHGAQLAVEEANARGGYGGKPFKLMLHNDYDNWQAKTVYGDDRPTDPTIWGSASNEAVKMVYDDQDWAIFGSISSESTHIALRVALKAEIPIVNSASTDPTIPETYIPWFFTDLQDDRVQGLTLARHIFTELGLKRVAILRVNNRYGRFGVDQVSRCIAAARPSGRHRAEVFAGRYGLFALTEDYPVVAGGCHCAVGRRDSGGEHSEADESAGDEAAGVWVLSHAGTGVAGRGRRMRQKDSRRYFRMIPLATIRSGLISTRASKRASTRSRSSLLRSRMTR